MNKLHVAAFLVSLAAASAFIIRPYPYNKVLDPEGRYTLLWDVKTGPNEVDFELVVNATGWIGFALVSQDGTFADFYWAGVDDNSTVPYFADMHMNVTDGVHGLPEADTNTQHVVFQGAVQEGDFTTVRFKRRIDTEDPEDVVIGAGDITVGWAWSDDDSAEVPHSDAGFTTVALIPGY